MSTSPGNTDTPEKAAVFILCFLTGTSQSVHRERNVRHVWSHVARCAFPHNRVVVMGDAPERDSASRSQRDSR